MAPRCLEVRDLQCGSWGNLIAKTGQLMQPPQTPLRIATGKLWESDWDMKNDKSPRQIRSKEVWDNG